jgi:cold shock CspA family protein
MNRKKRDAGVEEVGQLQGKVTWYHPKKGFGFISITDGPYEGASIFVHSSSIQASKGSMRYLVEGEMVSFSLIPSTDGEHEFQASNVRGMQRQPLMCESQRRVHIHPTPRTQPVVPRERKEEVVVSVVEDSQDVYSRQPWRLASSVKEKR